MPPESPVGGGFFGQASGFAGEFRSAYSARRSQRTRSGSRLTNGYPSADEAQKAIDNLTRTVRALQGSLERLAQQVQHATGGGVGGRLQSSGTLTGGVPNGGVAGAAYNNIVIGGSGNGGVSTPPGSAYNNVLLGGPKSGVPNGGGSTPIVPSSTPTAPTTMAGRLGSAAAVGVATVGTALSIGNRAYQRYGGDVVAMNFAANRASFAGAYNGGYQYSTVNNFLQRAAGMQMQMSPQDMSQVIGTIQNNLGTTPIGANRQMTSQFASQFRSAVGLQAVNPGMGAVGNAQAMAGLYTVSGQMMGQGFFGVNPYTPGGQQRPALQTELSILRGSTVGGKAPTAEMLNEMMRPGSRGFSVYQRWSQIYGADTAEQMRQLGLGQARAQAAGVSDQEFQAALQDPKRHRGLLRRLNIDQSAAERMADVQGAGTGALAALSKDAIPAMTSSLDALRHSVDALAAIMRNTPAGSIAGHMFGYGGVAGMAGNVLQGIGLYGAARSIFGRGRGGGGLIRGALRLGGRGARGALRLGGRGAVSGLEALGGEGGVAAGGAIAGVAALDVATVGTAAKSVSNVPKMLGAYHEASKIQDVYRHPERYTKAQREALISIQKRVDYDLEHSKPHGFWGTLTQNFDKKKTDEAYRLVQEALAGQQTGDSGRTDIWTAPGQTYNTLEKMLAKGPTHIITSTTDGHHAAGSYHYKGQAIDVADKAGSRDTPGLLAINRYLAKNYGKELAELIYAGPGGINIKDGKVVSGIGFYGPQTMAGHHDHVHVAATPASLHLKGGVDGGGNTGQGADSAASTGGFPSRIPSGVATGAYGSTSEAAAYANLMFSEAEASMGGMYAATGMSGGATSGGSTASNVGGMNSKGDPGVGHAPTSVKGNVALAKKMAAARRWTGAEWDALYWLWNQESGFNEHAGNSAGAWGIPQALPGSKMASAGPDWHDNPATQIKWGLDYIAGRYRDPISAVQHKHQTDSTRGSHDQYAQPGGWYDKGAWEIAADHTGRVHKGEMILPAEFASAVRDALGQTKVTGGSSRSVIVQPGAIVIQAGIGSVEDTALRRAAQTLLSYIEEEAGHQKVVNV